MVVRLVLAGGNDFFFRRFGWLGIGRAGGCQTLGARLSGAMMLSRVATSVNTTSSSISVTTKSHSKDRSQPFTGKSKDTFPSYRFVGLANF